jgi:hypothetical protein
MDIMNLLSGWCDPMLPSRPNQPLTARLFPQVVTSSEIKNDHVKSGDQHAYLIGNQGTM